MADEVYRGIKLTFTSPGYEECPQCIWFGFARASAKRWSLGQEVREAKLTVTCAGEDQRNRHMKGELSTVRPPLRADKPVTVYQGTVSCPHAMRMNSYTPKQYELFMNK